MKTKLGLPLLFLATLLSLPAFGQDRWDGEDKPKHVAASAISAIIVESAFAKTLTPVERFGLAMVPGVLKEFADMRTGGSGFSGKDIVADIAGVLSGMVINGVVVRHGFIGINIKF